MTNNWIKRVLHALTYTVIMVICIAIGAVIGSLLAYSYPLMGIAIIGVAIVGLFLLKYLELKQSKQ